MIFKFPPMTDAIIRFLPSKHLVNGDIYPNSIPYFTVFIYPK
jgi:hypothetical protein